MDRDGMYPPHNCKVCGKPLNSDGGHPAELYAGTYTGLCYTCEKGPEYIEKTYEDGARVWNFRPHCPSWRRDRETFIGFEGCPKCQGKGRIMIDRGFGMGGPYPINCPDCFNRHYPPENIIIPPKKKRK